MKKAPAFVFVVPMTVLLASYVYLALLHGQWNLADVIVHEDGTRTLTQTAFYVTHFLREVLVCIMIVLASVAVFWAISPAQSLRVSPAACRRLSGVFFAISTVILVISFIASVRIEGFHETIVEILQYRTRTEGALEFGSHWQYHLLHIVFMASAVAPAVLAFKYALSAHWQSLISDDPRRRIAPLLVCSALFCIITACLNPSTKPFLDVLYLAHQGREIATHSLISLPLLVGVLWCLEAYAFSAPSSVSRTPTPLALRFVLISTVVSVGVAGYVMFRLTGVDLISHAQKDTSLLDLFASHNFEHFIDYLFMMALAAACYAALISTHSFTSTRS